MNKYYVLNSRAGILALHNGGILDTKDNSKHIFFTGTLEECCKVANKEVLSVISDENFNIIWKLQDECGHWTLKHLIK